MPLQGVYYQYICCNAHGKIKGPALGTPKTPSGGRLADLPTGLALARMHGEDAPATPGQRFSTSSKPGYFPGCPGFFCAKIRVRRSLLPHQRQADDSDYHQENVAYSVDGVCIHGRSS